MRDLEDIKHNYGSEYALLLGAYLGDGLVVKTSITYKLIIACDMKYPKVIDLFSKTISILNSKVPSIVKSQSSNSCSFVTSYSNSWPTLFPQHGSGLKCDRDVSLKDWQKEIVHEYPLQFINGLFLTDGSRFIRKIRKPTGGWYQYPSYNFTNCSKDIIDAFCWGLEILKIPYKVTCHKKESLNERRLHWINETNYAAYSPIHKHDKFVVNVNKRNAVSFLDNNMIQKT